jgi:integrase
VIRFWHEGRTKQVTLQTRDLAIARAAYEHLLPHLKAPSAHNEPTGKRLSEFRREFAWRDAGGTTSGRSYARRARGTAENHAYVLKHFERICGDVYLHEIKYPMIERFKSHRLQHDGVSRATINNNLQSLGAAMREAMKLEYIDTKPTIELYELNQSLPKLLSQDEQARLLHQCEPLSRMDRFMRIALLSGLRPSEVVNLLWVDVDLVAGVIVVRATKGRKDRTVPLHPQLREYLARLPREGDRVCNSLTYDAVQKSFERNATCTAHVLRHTFASWFVMSGGEITALKEILGHASMKATMVYAHLVPAHKQREMAKLPCLPSPDATGTHANSPETAETPGR